ncbi:hypothetical protein [Paracoccus sp. ME4]|uniref:hypothetical protein n=1 Tax=Paracoccus sp. ME4 TaxID=3138066 RepID=UPI00398A9000
MRLEELRALSPSIIAAAQSELDAWQQDEEGMDEKLGSGGACQEISDAIARIIGGAGGTTAEIFTEFDGGHVFLMAHLDEGAFSVDIPPFVYEYGAGYSWTKREGVRLSPDDLVIQKLEDPMSEAAFLRRYTEDGDTFAASCEI